MDGVEKYCSKNFNELEVWEEGVDTLKYDLEDYTTPAVFRRVLKKTKLKEIVEIRTTRLDKLTDHFDDDVFNREWLSSFKDEVVITVGLC